MDFLKGYRTIIFNLIMAAAAALSAFGVIGPEEVPGEEEVYSTIDKLIAAVMVVGNLVLRFITTTPVGVKKE